MTNNVKRRTPLVLVAGGDTPVRESIIEWFDVASDAIVLPVKLRADADRLLSKVEHPELLHIVQFDIEGHDDYEKLRTFLEETGKLLTVVDVIGGWQVRADGRLAEVDDGSTADDPHHRLAAAMFPVLSGTDGVYIQVVWTDEPLTPGQNGNLAKAVNAVIEHGQGLSNGPEEVKVCNVWLEAPLVGHWPLDGHLPLVSHWHRQTGHSRAHDVGHCVLGVSYHPHVRERDEVVALPRTEAVADGGDAVTPAAELFTNDSAEVVETSSGRSHRP